MKITKYLLVLTLFLAAAACKTNPLTGESNFNIYSNETIFPTSFAQYNGFLQENNVVTGTAEAQLIRDVGIRIKNAAQRWFNAIGHPEYLNGYEWEYNLVKDETVNAWCMPGGKIVFYTGIMPICENNDGVAVVMGHEVAHALLNHGAQRMSSGTLQQAGAGILAVGTELAGTERQNQQLFMQAYGISTGLGMLKYSRDHEREADKVGLYLTAIAGYDPYEASELWKRMQAESGGQAPPEFMSTHPSTESRIQRLSELAPEAAKEAEKYRTASTQ